MKQELFEFEERRDEYLVSCTVFFEMETDLLQCQLHVFVNGLRRYAHFFGGFGIFEAFLMA